MLFYCVHILIIVAASWHFYQGQCILPRLTSETTNKFTFAMKLKLERLFRKDPVYIHVMENARYPTNSMVSPS
jgi:hypothetical protein